MNRRPWGPGNRQPAPPHAKPPSATFREPELRRWPHDNQSAPPPPEQDADRQFYRCSLSYQNQTLAEIKTLLERLALDLEEGPKSP